MSNNVSTVIQYLETTPGAANGLKQSLAEICAAAGVNYDELTDDEKALLLSYIAGKSTKRSITGL